MHSLRVILHRNCRNYPTVCLKRHYSSTPNPAPTESSQKSEPSSCPQGTIMKDLNVWKDKTDPVAMADEEYPDWLWTLLDKKTTWTAEEKLTTKYLRRLTQEKIKINALKKL